MKNSKIKRLLHNVIKARAKYESCIGEISTCAKMYMEFPHDDIIFCEYQPSDGYVLVLDAGSRTPYNMPIDSFFRIAKEKGIVTIEDFEKESI